MREPSRWRKTGNDDPQRRRDTALAKKRKAHRLGYVAELIALLFLLMKGYRPMARRYAAAGGEVDLIMRRGQVIIFVEVKARNHTLDAVHAIDAKKRIKFGRAVKAWLSRNPKACVYSLRCDAVYVIGGWRPFHVEGAFELR